MVIDVFIWSYERDAVAIRMANLSKSVDAHVAVQASNTFRGEPRKVTMLDLPNCIDVVVTIPAGLDPWESEKWLRDMALTKAAELCPYDAFYMVSDGDEIPHPLSIKESTSRGVAMKLRTDYRSFYADWRAVDHVLEHQATIGTLEQYAAAGGANEARWHGNWESSYFSGWHLSSLGNDDAIALKLSTFAHTEYDTDEYKANLSAARGEMRDFLNRFDLEYTEDLPKGVPAHLLGGNRK